MEDLILRIGQLDGLTVDDHLIVHTQHQLLLFRLRPIRALIDVVPPQQGPDPGNELRGRKRLAEIVVSSGRQSRHLFRVSGHGGKKEDGRIAAFTDAAADLEAVHAGHHNVQDDKVHRAVNFFQSLAAAGSRLCIVALALQQKLDDLCNIPVIVNN